MTSITYRTFVQLMRKRMKVGHTPQAGSMLDGGRPSFTEAIGFPIRPEEDYLQLDSKRQRGISSDGVMCWVITHDA